MNRRLYFLLPDSDHTRATAADLRKSGIPAEHIHAVTDDPEPDPQLPAATPWQQRDLAGRMERSVWNANLALFAMAAAGCLAALLTGAWAWAALAAIVMLASFLAGERFTHLPSTHLNQFQDALHHGEILLMVDVPRDKVASVERRVSRQHPEAVPAGTCWQTDVLAV